MKYIYTILVIILLVSCTFAFLNFQVSVAPPDENALLVNDRVIPFAELQQMWQQKPYHYRSQEEFIDDLVLRELLIEQAIDTGIADEIQFKRLIKDFFEQSLVKTLLDRKQIEQTVAISQSELTDFRTAQNQHYHLTLLRYQTYTQALADKSVQQQQIDEDFAALPETLQVHLFSMQQSEMTTPFLDGSDFVRLRLDRVEELPIRAQTISDDELRQNLSYLLQQKLLEEWILHVRQQASVRYPQQKLENGGQ